MNRVERPQEHTVEPTELDRYLPIAAMFAIAGIVAIILMGS
jgi:hypothetical protein